MGLSTGVILRFSTDHGGYSVPANPHRSIPKFMKIITITMEPAIPNTEQKSETILTKDNRFYFRKLPSKSRLSHCIIEIIADKDRRFLQKIT